jgi:hypothetical protein
MASARTHFGDATSVLLKSRRTGSTAVPHSTARAWPQAPPPDRAHGVAAEPCDAGPAPAPPRTDPQRRLSHHRNRTEGHVRAPCTTLRVQEPIRRHPQALRRCLRGGGRPFHSGESDSDCGVQQRLGRHPRSLHRAEALVLEASRRSAGPVFWLPLCREALRGSSPLAAWECRRGRVRVHPVATRDGSSEQRKEDGHVHRWRPPGLDHRDPAPHLAALAKADEQRADSGGRGAAGTMAVL